MNERIKDLAEKAGWRYVLGGNPRTLIEDREYLVTNQQAEKFAELIIMECVNICKDLEGEYNIDARSGRQDCVVEIKEHFGVEE